MIRPAKYSELKAGDTIIADGGFTCIAHGRACQVRGHADHIHGLHVMCCGEEDNPSNYCSIHDLDGQIDDDGDTLIGFYVQTPELTGWEDQDNVDIVRRALAAGWWIDGDRWWTRAWRYGDVPIPAGEDHFGFRDLNDEVYVRCARYAIAYDKGFITRYGG